MSSSLSNGLRISLLTGFMTLATASAGLASPEHELPFGEVADSQQATRTVTITMRDNLYEPESLSVTAGEIVRFVIVNEGELLHEFNIGTAAMHAEHQEEMAMMMDHGMLTPTGMKDMSEMDHAEMEGMDMDDMKHDDPNSVLVAPGTTAELVWKFTEPTELEFACNVPGHYESGMAGPINFTK